MQNKSHLVRYDWTLNELNKLYEMPLLKLIFESNRLHAQFHQPGQIQLCNLISIKTGGCPEDCKYCAQSARYNTSVTAQPMMRYEEVLSAAKTAVARGATRVCMGAAWREVRAGKAFDEILRMIKGVAELGVEVCVTLGMLKPEHAKALKEAGLYAYNHNLDTSERYYKMIITTRTYQDRLNTLDIVDQAKLSVCCGGILGLGETPEDRLQFLLTLCRRNPHPESVPINRLSQIPGTPLAQQPPLSTWEMIRVIALARVLMPAAMVRISCGRAEMSHEQQTLCFLAGANSIFIGDKYLTVGNAAFDQDEQLFQLLGLTKRPAYLEVAP